LDTAYSLCPQTKEPTPSGTAEMAQALITKQRIRQRDTVTSATRNSPAEPVIEGEHTIETQQIFYRLARVDS